MRAAGAFARLAIGLCAVIFATAQPGAPAPSGAFLDADISGGSAAPAAAPSPEMSGTRCPDEAGIGASSRPEDLEKVERAKEILREQDWGRPRPPVFLFPGLASSRLVAWKGKKCIGPDINVMDNLWLNIQKVVETLTFDQNCWLDCLKLGHNQTDPEDCKVRAANGLEAVSVLSPGLFTEKPTMVYQNLISYIADAYGYDKNSIYGFPYDWRLSPGKLEERDGFFSSTKERIEAAVRLNGRPGIIFAHSMGNNCVMYFFKWLRARYPRTAEAWIAKHVWTFVMLAPPLLGAVSPLKSVLTGEPMGMPITDRMARDLELTFGVTHWVNPMPPRGHNPPRPHAYANGVGAAGCSAAVNGTAGVCPAGESEGPTWDADLVRVRVKEGSAEATFGAEDVATGEIFRWMGAIYNDEALSEKYRTLYSDYIESEVNFFDGPPQRPPVKHVVVAYGVDQPTERKYTLSNDVNFDYPIMSEMTVEEAGQDWNVRVGGRRARTQKKLLGPSELKHSGDGLIPYQSLSWSHTWLGDNATVAHWKRRTYKRSTFLDQWTPEKLDMAATVTQPALTCLHGAPEASPTVDPVTVLEFEGVNHHKITGDPNVMKVVWDLIIGNVVEEMCIEGTDEVCRYQDAAPKRKAGESEAAASSGWGLSLWGWPRSKDDQAKDKAKAAAGGKSGGGGAAEESRRSQTSPMDEAASRVAAAAGLGLPTGGDPALEPLRMQGA